MTHRHAFEALDRTLQDIMCNDQPFCGKVVLLGEDFKQILPIAPKASERKLLMLHCAISKNLEIC